MKSERLKQKFEEEMNRIKHLGEESKRELQDNYAAAKILLKFLEEKPVSADEIQFLKAQSVDFTKVLVLIGLQAVPGSSIAIITLEKIGKQHGFTLFPNPDRTIPDLK